VVRLHTTVGTIGIFSSMAKGNGGYCKVVAKEEALQEQTTMQHLPFII